MSKKYVIEMKSEYEDTIRGIMVLGARDSNLYMDALAVEDMEELNSDYINEHYGSLQGEAYQRGVEDGRNESWEAARKVALNTNDGGLSIDNLNEIFDCYSLQQVFRGYTVSEVIDRIKAYEDKQKAENEIKVGDEVCQVTDSGTETGLLCTVTSYDGDSMGGFSQDGRVIVCSSQVNRWWKKTGKHYDIDKILEEMKK